MLAIDLNMWDVCDEAASYAPRQTSCKFLTKFSATSVQQIGQQAENVKTLSTVCKFPVPKFDTLSGFFARLRDFRPFPFAAIGGGKERRLLYGIPSVGFIHRSVLVAQLKTHLRGTMVEKIVAQTAWSYPMGKPVLAEIEL